MLASEGQNINFAVQNIKKQGAFFVKLNNLFSEQSGLPESIRHILMIH